MSHCEVAAALEAARAKFHGLAAAIRGHLDGHYKIDLERFYTLLQEGNENASQALEMYRKEFYHAQTQISEAR
jgi:hypothetical protein